VSAKVPREFSGEGCRAAPIRYLAGLAVADWLNSVSPYFTCETGVMTAGPVRRRTPRDLTGGGPLLPLVDVDLAFSMRKPASVAKLAAVSLG